MRQNLRISAEAKSPSAMQKTGGSGRYTYNLILRPGSMELGIARTAYREERTYNLAREMNLVTVDHKVPRGFAHAASTLLVESERISWRNEERAREKKE